jgi:hypothetical protein
VKVFRYVGILLVAGAIICAAVVAWSLRPGRYEGWIETTGTVIDHEVTWSTDSETRRRTELRAPVIEFTDESGQRVVITAATSSSDWPAVGSSVRLRYPPGQPTEALTDKEGHFVPIFFGIWALVLGFVGTVFLMLTKMFNSATPAPGRRTTQPEIVEDTSEPTDLTDGPSTTDSADDPWPRYARPDDE